MKILVFGDVVGKAGRNALKEHLPKLQHAHQPDFIIVNGENAAHGFGISRKIYDEFIHLGVDVITGGDHQFDQKETLFFIEETDRMIRPANFPKQLPGKGHIVVEKNGKKLAVLHLHAQIFMKYQVNSPFEMADELLKTYQLNSNVDAIMVDFHGEATSEKMAMGHYLDGRVSAVIGTHTHVPTADSMILPAGTAYQTDLGMCGDYDSVIGNDKAICVANFLTQIRTQKLTPASGEGSACGALIEIATNGKATHIHPIKAGGILGNVN